MGKKYLLLNKVLDKIKESIRIYDEKYDDTKILIDTDHKFSGKEMSDVTLKNLVVLIPCIIKNGYKFYQQKLLKELLVEKRKIRRKKVYNTQVYYTSVVWKVRVLANYCHSLF